MFARCKRRSAAQQNPYPHETINSPTVRQQKHSKDLTLEVGKADDVSLVASSVYRRIVVRARLRFRFIYSETVVDRDHALVPPTRRDLGAHHFEHLIAPDILDSIPQLEHTTEHIQLDI
jgi:hypothetical protein